MDAQLKKGVLEMCILYAIAQKARYGYDIMKQMHDFFPEVNESTFYAILRRLNREGLTEAYYSGESGGPPRKYYRILDKGNAYLEQSISHWRILTAAVREIGIS